MCKPSGDSTASNGMPSTLFHCRMIAKRWNRPAFPAFAAPLTSATIASVSGLAMTFGAYCGSIRTTSAPDAFSRWMPSSTSGATPATAWSRRTVLVPTCHTTRSGCSERTAALEARQHLRRLLAVHAAIENLDRNAGEARAQLSLEAGGIGHRGRAGACAGGGGGADGDDRQRLAKRKASRRMRKRLPEPAGLRGRGAGRRRLRRGLG